MSSLASEATTAMIDRDLLWVADRNLMVASLSARLRDLAESHADCNSLHVSELWPQDDPFSIVAVAHQWALDGECVDFETTRLGEKYVVTLEPLLAPDGTVTAVAGRAAPADGRRVHWQLEALEEVEHLCGFGTWRIDARTSELTWSSGLARLLGASDEVTQDVRDFDHPEDAEAVAEAIRQGEITGKGYKCDHRIIRGDRTVRYVQEQARVAYDDDGVACAVIGSMLDITERKLAEERLAQLAHYDPVSNLPNRTLLEERLGVALARAKRNAATCGVLFLDVDAFKVVNDTYGHAAGDDLLAAIGSRLTRHIRLSDTVARISGDEFVVVLDQLTSHEDAVEAARKIAKCFDLPFTLGEHNCRITASIGVATYPDTGSTARELLEAADAEMYIVKRNGGRGIKAAPSQKETCVRADENTACRISSAVQPISPFTANVLPSF